MSQSAQSRQLLNPCPPIVSGFWLVEQAVQPFAGKGRSVSTFLTIPPYGLFVARTCTTSPSNPRAERSGWIDYCVFSISLLCLFVHLSRASYPGGSSLNQTRTSFDDQYPRPREQSSSMGTMRCPYFASAL